MLKSRKFWAYDPCQAFDLKDEIFENYKMKGKFHDDVQYFYDVIGIAPHPCFKIKQNKSEPGVPPPEISCLEILNSKVDINTLKIIFFLLPHSKIYNIKLISNDWDIDNLEFFIKSLLEKNNNIFYLSFEWNDKLCINGTSISIKSEIDYQNNIEIFKREKKLLCRLFQSPSKLEGISLRGDFIGDETAIQIFNILEKNTTVKALNLFYDNLTPKCFEAFCQMLLTNRKLEDINLGKNFFTDECIEKLTEYIGKFPMTIEEVADYNKKTKDREKIIAINAANAKAKSKKPEIEVPFLYEMQLIGEVYYTVKNKDFKVINFMQNPLTDKCYDSLIKVFDLLPDLFITIDNKVLSDEHKNTFLDKKSQYYDKMYFSK